MSDVLVKEVRAIQADMVESAAESNFSESELDDLRGTIRLTVEFSHYLGGWDPLPNIPGVKEKAMYVCESVFSGVDSFASVNMAYDVLRGARPSALAPGAKSTESLKEEFALKYGEFIEEKDFMPRCRLLLDLFKLQIVFAGLSY
jgi:hypothetical protein